MMRRCPLALAWSIAIRRIKLPLITISIPFQGVLLVGDNFQEVRVLLRECGACQKWRGWLWLEGTAHPLEGIPQCVMGKNNHFCRFPTFANHCLTWADCPSILRLLPSHWDALCCNVSWKERIFGLYRIQRHCGPFGGRMLWNTECGTVPELDGGPLRFGIRVPRIILPLFLI